MAQDRHKEDLKKLLVFLGRIIHDPENSWFVDELYSMLPSKRDDEKSLAKIEKYLGLDYNIDKVVPLIDFSFVAVIMLFAQSIFEVLSHDKVASSYQTTPYWSYTVPAE